MVVLSDRAIPPESRQARLLVKLELQNPGGSLKDRIALNIVEEAEKRGDLKEGMTLVDFTSGNTGIGYAMIAAAKGYKCIVVMPRVRAMLERYLICRQFGADVHLINPARGAVDGIEYVKELCERDDYWWANQLGNEDNPTAHVKSTGPEIWRQADEEVDYFVHGIGTGGCIAGVGKYLKSKNPNCKIVAMEPTESRVHVGRPSSSHGIVGWSPGIHSQFIEGVDLPPEMLSDQPRGVVDEWGHVSTEDAVATAREVCRKQGLMCGPSSGASLKYAFDIAARPEAKGKTIVVVIPSHAIRYCAHPLWGPVQQEAEIALPPGEPPCSDKTQPVLLWDSASPSSV